MSMDQAKRKRINQALNSLEQLSWVLNSKSFGDLASIPGLLRELIAEESNGSVRPNMKGGGRTTNSSFLVGALPKLFQDTELFATNTDLAEFGSSVLHTEINRAEKRSRYEIIGLIISHVVEMSEAELDQLVVALSRIKGDLTKLKQIRARGKKADFSWNEAIQTLAKL